MSNLDIQNDIDAARAHPLRFVARLTIEQETPSHFGAGREWDASDAGVVFDANGLPALPGSSVAGILRSGFSDPKVANSIFGYQGPAGAQNSEGSGSRLNVSWGCIHRGDDTPVYGVVEHSLTERDLVLQNAVHSVIRDHVRISERGVADQRGFGKFDEIVVCAGHRFTFELELEGNVEDSTHWRTLLEMLRDPFTRFGGKTRRGLGRFRLVRGCQRHFNLTRPEDFKAYENYEGRLDELVDLANHDWSGWESVEAEPLAQTKGRKWELDLAALNFWMFGGGDDDTADMAPVREERIIWRNTAGKESAKPEECYVIPGASVKGALSHRTLFHSRALAGAFANQADFAAKDEIARRSHASIFGSAKTNDTGTPGRLLLDDVVLTPEELQHSAEGDPCRFQQHNSIDALTGGSRDQHLFNDRPLYRGGFTLRVLLAPPALEAGESGQAELAFERSLADLCTARLALGGGTGRGRGRFNGALRQIHPALERV